MSLEENKEKKRLYGIEYRKKNKSEIAKKKKEYRKKNKSEIASYYETYKDTRNKKARERYNTDDLFRITKNIRNLIKKTFKSKSTNKNNKTTEILGCSFDEFKQHIESQWEDWMSWDNYGQYNGEENYGWDIDHRTPIASALNESEVIRLNHFTNLQPLCSYINRDVKKDYF